MELVPADDKEDDGPRPGAAGLEAASAAEALAGHHWNSLARKQEQESPHSQSGGDIGVVNAVVVVHLLVLHHFRLPKQTNTPPSPTHIQIRKIQSKIQSDPSLCVTDRAPSLLGGDGEAEGDEIQDEDDDEDKLRRHCLSTASAPSRSRSSSGAAKRRRR